MLPDEILGPNGEPLPTMKEQMKLDNDVTLMFNWMKTLNDWELTEILKWANNPRNVSSFIPPLVGATAVGAAAASTK